jgi:hypothetical protein
MLLFSNRSGGGLLNQIGCLIVGVLALVALFWTLDWLYRALWIIAPVLLVLALLINWRIVAGTGKSLVQQIQRNPLGGILSSVLAVCFFPLLTLYWIMAGLGLRRIERFQREFGQQWGGPPSDGFDFANKEHNPHDTEYTDYEEIESKPPEDK